MKITLFVLFILCTSLFAKEKGSRSEGKGGCKADQEKFCKGVEPGEGRIVKCLKEHEAQLSAECKARRTQKKEHTKALKEACKDDAIKFCNHTKEEHEKIGPCLKEHKAELSQTCKIEIEKGANK